MITRLTDKLGPMMEASFNRASMNGAIPPAEDWCWEMTTAMHQTMGTVLYLSVMAPSAVLGELLSSGLVVPAPSTISQEGADSLVAQLIENVNAERSKQVSGVARMTGDVSAAGSILDLAPPGG